jgi:hypothetical protein
MSWPASRSCSTSLRPAIDVVADVTGETALGHPTEVRDRGRLGQPTLDAVDLHRAESDDRLESLIRLIVGCTYVLR